MSIMNRNIPGGRYIRYCLQAAALLGLSVSLADACTNDCAIDVYFTGKYVDETCEIVINNGSNEETVTLPTISALSLKGDGSEAGSKPFDISLKECPTGRTVTVYFTSSAAAADPSTGNLTNAVGDAYSQNVQVRLRKENSTQVVIDDSSTGQDYIIPSTNSPVTHTFTASYYAKGDSAVTAGTVNTAASVEIVYK